jgi:uncharacterized protein (DUF3820 family)
MLSAHYLAKNPPRFSISDKKSTGNCASSFLDLPESYLWYLNRGDAPDGRGVRGWLLRLKIDARVQLSRFVRLVTSTLTTYGIAILTLGIP